MEVKIGVQHAARELVVETDENAETHREAVAEAVGRRAACSPSPTPRAARILVPAAKLAYVEIGGGVAGQVGFRS